MRSVLALLLAALFSSSAAAQTKRYIIGFDPGASPADKARALKSLGATAVDSLEEFDALVAEVPVQPFSVMEEKILSEPGVAQVEEDVYVNWLQDFEPLPALKAPVFAGRTSVSAAALPPGVSPAEVPWGVARVNAPAAWSKTQGNGVRVAVLDTGIASDHPDLKGQVVGCYNAFDKSKPCIDENHHGTHVAGTIAALWDGKGVVGVAPKAQLVAVKVLDEKGGANLTSVIKGILWTAKNNIQVANMSLGSPIGIIFMRLAINYATDRGVVFVAAAGNNGKKVEYPGGYPNVIAVSASDERDRISSFSSRGDKVEFIAPGEDVKSTVPGGGYDWLSGTSMATPHVAGLAALAVSRGYRGIDAVRKALTRAAKPIGLKPTEQGRGLIDAAVLVR
ncbi:MAG: S8 family peptidase [Elusimicrobia bacterium]|nr:S8 family peptidase [Elusimicrobiota bacterium]